MYKSVFLVNTDNNKPNWLLVNLFSLCLLVTGLIFFSWGAHQVKQPIKYFNANPIDLDYQNLFFYGMRTIFRMCIAIFISVLFSIIYASIALRNKRAQQIMIPMLDVLQSVPILGYISFTVGGFVALAPDTIWGFEMAAIFAIFTSQAWNITFCVYQSLQNVPQELLEVAKNYQFSNWRTFWVVKIPYAVPAIVWNSMVSMSGAWFFVVAAESISYAGSQIQLPGIGSYIALALQKQNTCAMFAAVLVMAGIILIFDFIIFKSLVAWSAKFRYETDGVNHDHDNWLINILWQSFLIRYICYGLKYLAQIIVNLPFNSTYQDKPKVDVNGKYFGKYFDVCWYGFLIAVLTFCLIYIAKFMANVISVSELIHVCILTSITFLRLVILLIICSLILVPLGIYIGSNPVLTKVMQPIIQFLSAFPANLFFPSAVILITKYNLNPDIWLSPLMLMAAQWYILFNVIAGSAQIPAELRDLMKAFRIGGILKYRKIIIPAIMPYYVTGLISAAGAGWNASIIAEAVSWGSQNIYAHGIGAYITEMTRQNNFHKLVLGIIVMSIFVVIFNKIFWSRLYNYVTTKFSYI